MDLNLKANEGKKLVQELEGKKFARYAVKTHFVKVGDNLDEVIKEYVIPIYQEGDIVTIGEKIVALCQEDVVYKKDLKVSWLAKLLSKFVVKNKHCYGLRNVYKMQVAIDLVGPVKILYAAVVAAIGKVFGKRGLFYEILGKGVSNIDGFGDEGFEYYRDMGTYAPTNPEKACQHIKDTYGVDCMIVDANDLGVEILASNKEIREQEELVLKLLKDNPAGQDKQQTPIILIREYVKDVAPNVSA